MAGTPEKMRMALAVLALCLLGSTGWAATSRKVSTKAATAAEMELATKWNANVLNVRGQEDKSPERPVAEYSQFKYLLMTGSTMFSSDDFKTKIAQNLPADMSLVILVQPGEEAATRRKFSPMLSADRLIIATHNTAPEGFWSRDSFPYPVYMDNEKNVRLVWARYFRNFQAGYELAKTVKASVRKETYYFVGGNMMADDEGRCLVVQSDRLFGLTDTILQQAYGCKSVHRFEYLEGIGDVDEVIKVLPNRQALTTISSYVPKLQEMGYEVGLLPRLRNYRTYANSVILNGTVFMPSYGVATDEQAKKVYESFGYTVVMADSEMLSTRGLGSFHCTTMAYPEIDIASLLEKMGAKIN